MTSAPASRLSTLREIAEELKRHIRVSVDQLAIIQEEIAAEEREVVARRAHLSLVPAGAVPARRKRSAVAVVCPGSGGAA